MNSWLHRKEELEFGAFFELGFDVDADIVEAEDLVGEGEADAVARITEGVGAAEEGLEDLLEVFLSDADPGIADTDDRGIVLQIQAE